MSVLKGLVKLSVAGKTLNFKASEFNSPEGWGFWIAEKEDEGVEVRVHSNGSASVDRYDDRSYFNLTVEQFPKELRDGTKVAVLENTLRLPYTRNHDEDND